MSAEAGHALRERLRSLRTSEPHGEAMAADPGAVPESARAVRAFLDRARPRDGRRPEAPPARPAASLGGEPAAELQRFPAAHRHGVLDVRAADEILRGCAGDAAWAAQAASLSRGAPSCAALAGALFLDAETTGLSTGAGTLAWLVGLAWFDRRGSGAVELVVEHLLLREIADEAELLRRLRARLQGAAALVTFNGRTFDLPLLESRFVLNRLGAPPDRPHLDLLHPARRLLGGRLADSRLVSLERHVLGFDRGDDVPASEIPAAWFTWLRSGRTEGVERARRHVTFDLLSLVALTAVLLRVVRPGSATTVFAHDPLGLAEHRCRAGDRDAARELLRDELVLPPAPGGARPGRRARLAKRLLGPLAALELWRAAASRGSLEAHEEIAKVLEHRLRDVGGALAVTRAALGRIPQDERPGLRRRLEHRLARLDRLVTGAGGRPGAPPAVRLPPHGVSG